MAGRKRKILSFVLDCQTRNFEGEGGFTEMEFQRQGGRAFWNFQRQGGGGGGNFDATRGMVRIFSGIAQLVFTLIEINSVRNKDLT